MKFIYAVFALSAVVSSVSATPTLFNRYIKRDVPSDLIPQFGVTAGLNPSGTGDCDGVDGPTGQPIKIPCDCPPPREQFIADLNANVAAGHCINNTEVTVPPFPTDNSTASQLTIFHICTITLQNLVGQGKGCPQSSTTWSAQAAAVQAKANSAPPSSAPPPSSAAPPSPAAPSSSAVSSSSSADTSDPICSAASPPSS